MNYSDPNRFNKIGAYLCELTQKDPNVGTYSDKMAEHLFQNDPFVVKNLQYDVAKRGADWTVNRFKQCYKTSIEQGRQQGVLDPRCYSGY